MKITIVTPSIRPDGVVVVARALSDQEMPTSDWEWVLSVPENKKKETEKVIDETLLPGASSVVLTDPPKQEGDAWTFNKAMNEIMRQSRGELIVSWQDWIWAPIETLDKFWFWHDYFKGEALVSGSGDQYQSLGVGGIPMIKVWADPRRQYMVEKGGFYGIPAADWEANFAMAPKQAFYDVGGWDEEMDKRFGMDNVSVVQRIEDLGKYEFYIDHDIECRGVKHGRPSGWDDNHWMNKGEYQRRKMEAFKSGDWPQMPYLK